MKRLLLALVLSSACATHVPPSLTGPGIIAFQANRIGVPIGTVQHTAIELNKIQVCNPAPCHPFLSNADTRIVVDAATEAAMVLRATPAGWQVTANLFISRLEARLTAAGKGQLGAYLEVVRTVMNSIAKETK